MATQTASAVLCSAGTKVQWQFTAGQRSGLYGSVELFLYLPTIGFPVQTHQEDSSGCPLLRTRDEIKLQRLDKGKESFRLYAFIKGASLMVRCIQLPDSIATTWMSSDCIVKVLFMWKKEKKQQPEESQTLVQVENTGVTNNINKGSTLFKCHRQWASMHNTRNK